MPTFCLSTLLDSLFPASMLVTLLAAEDVPASVVEVLPGVALVSARNGLVLARVTPGEGGDEVRRRAQSIDSTLRGRSSRTARFVDKTLKQAYNVIIINLLLMWCRSPCFRRVDEEAEGY
jgi:hypothetical protein